MNYIYSCGKRAIASFAPAVFAALKKDVPRGRTIIVGTGVLDGPQNILTNYGEIANKHLTNMSDFYDNIKIDKFVIMPNHIHLLMQISKNDKQNGQSGTPVPTKFFSCAIYKHKGFKVENMAKTYGNPVLTTILFVGKKIIRKYGNT